MKKSIFIASLLTIVFASCDRVEHPYIPATPTELDQTLFPGDWSTYPWPTFTTNINANRNILLEDYTGHKCVFCPAAGAIAEQIEIDNPGRVFVASIHSSPGGAGPFQLTDAEFPYDFTNAQGIAYGVTFANGFGFDANPKGTINRKYFSGTMFQGANNWTSATTQTLTDNVVNANLQAVVNYFPATRGLFLHTEIDTMNQNASDLSVVVYLIEELYISKQKFPGGVIEEAYEHHNVHRGSIDGKAFGRTLKADDLNANGKFYQNYSYKLPAQYDPAKCHLLVYVMDKNTYEVHQVVKVDIP
jgi:hypothetical protein